MPNSGSICGWLLPVLSSSRIAWVLDSRSYDFWSLAIAYLLIGSVHDFAV